MSRIRTALHNDVQALALTRDELALQAHLLRADMRDRWQELETEWQRVQEHVQRAEVAAGDARPQIEAAASLLAETLRSGYADVRRALRG